MMRSSRNKTNKHGTLFEGPIDGFHERHEDSTDSLFIRIEKEN
jgi:hypothetical protein